jgi:hypothetical protein
VAASIYRRLITKPIFSNKAKRISLRIVSINWYAFLQIPSAILKKAQKGTQAVAACKEAVEEEYC